MAMPAPPLLINAVLFQAVWFAAVIGAGSGRAWPGVLAVAVFAAVTLVNRDTRASDLRLMAVAAVAGGLLDSVFVATGLLRYAAPWPLPGLAPAWIVALWVGLALGLHHSLRWLRPHPARAALLGALAAPLSYLGAARGWDAVAFAVPTWRTLLIVAACWAALLAGLVALARRDAATLAGPHRMRAA
jgi:hypothetical protein